MKKIICFLLLIVLLLSLSIFAFGELATQEVINNTRVTVDTFLKYLGTESKGDNLNIDAKDFNAIFQADIFGYIGSVGYNDEDGDDIIDIATWSCECDTLTSIERFELLNNLSSLFSCVTSKREDDEQMYFWVDHNAKTDSLCGTMMQQKDGVLYIYWSIGGIGQQIIDIVDEYVIKNPISKGPVPPTPEPTPTPTPKVTKGIWQIKHYVDKFGDETEDIYMTNTSIVSGTYNDVYATKDKLNARFLIDHSSLSIMLFENGKYDVKNHSSLNKKYYNLTIKKTDGSKEDFIGYINPGATRLYIDSDYWGLVLNSFYGKEGNVSIYIEEQDNPITNYLFTVECDNFIEIFDEAFN